MMVGTIISVLGLMARQMFDRPWFLRPPLLARFGDIVKPRPTGWPAGFGTPWWSLRRLPFS